MVSILPDYVFVFISIAIASYYCQTATGAVFHDIAITSGVPARIYVPFTNPYKKLPLLVYYHGGGFIGGTTFSPPYDNFVSSIANKANVIVLSVDYRLAPANPIPAAYDDSWSSLQYVASHYNGNGPNPILNTLVNFQKIFLAGDSAGANIAHHMGIRISSENIQGLNINGIALLCPYFWGAKPIGLEPIDSISREPVAYYWQQATQNTIGLDDPRINPLKDPKLPTLGTRKVLVVTGNLDPLVYRGSAYAQALRTDGYKGAVDLVPLNGEHDFFIFSPGTPEALAVLNRVSSFLNSA